MARDTSTSFRSFKKQGVEAIYSGLALKMTRRETKFSQADITRVFKAAKAAGEQVQVEIRPDGTIIAAPVTRQVVGAQANEWDSAE